MLIVDETNTQYNDRIGRIDKGVRIYPFLTDADPESEQGIAGYISVYLWDMLHTTPLSEPNIHLNMSLNDRYTIDQLKVLRDALDKAMDIASADVKGAEGA